jgi:hypothetical protein
VSLRCVTLLVLTSLALGGCTAALPLAAQPTLDNIQALRRSDIGKVAVGAFVPGPGAATAMDRRIVVRADSQPAPKASKGSYAQFLGDTLAAELNAAGKLDSTSLAIVSGVITDAHVDSAMPTAHARLSARFTLRRAGIVAFEKDFTAEANWRSSILGAAAIPDAYNHYVGLFSALVSQLLADPDFKAAAKAV